MAWHKEGWVPPGLLPGWNRLGTWYRLLPHFLALAHAAGTGAARSAAVSHRKSPVRYFSLAALDKPEKISEAHRGAPEAISAR